MFIEMRVNFWHAAPPVMESPKKHLKWSDKSMVEAIRAVKHRFSVNRLQLNMACPKLLFKIESAAAYNTGSDQALNHI